MSLEHAQQALETASREHHRLTQQREQIRQSLQAIGQAYHFVDLERGVRRNGPLSDIRMHIATIRTVAQHENLSQRCLDRIDKAERVVPTMQATIEFVPRYVRQQVDQLDLPQPASFVIHARLIPSSYLDRVAQTLTVRDGQPLRELAHHLRTSLFEPEGALSQLRPETQDALRHQAKALAEVFQRSSANVEGRNGYLSLRNHQLRGLNRPCKRMCLITIHNFASPALMAPRLRSGFLGRNRVPWSRKPPEFSSLQVGRKVVFGLLIRGRWRHLAASPPVSRSGWRWLPGRRPLHSVVASADADPGPSPSKRGRRWGTIPARP